MLLILRKIERDIIINVSRSSCQVSVILERFYENLHFLGRFSNVSPRGQTDGNIDGRTDRKRDRYSEANSSFEIL